MKRVFSFKLVHKWNVLKTEDFYRNIFSSVEAFAISGKIPMGFCNIKRRYFKAILIVFMQLSSFGSRKTIQTQKDFKIPFGMRTALQPLN